MRRMLELFNGASSANELCARVSLADRRAREVLSIRDRQPGGRFGSFDALQDVWSLDAGIFPRVYGVLGPPGMGQWQTLPYQSPPVAHSILLHTGFVLLLPESDALFSWLWDPSDLEHPLFSTPGNQPGGSTLCSGHAQLSDGRILFAGGGGGSPVTSSSRAFLFDPDALENGRWSELPRMQFRRWYPTVLTLGGGHVLIGGGTSNGVAPIAPMELFHEDTQTFTRVSGPPGAPDAANLSWSEVYPGLHLLPSGQILFTRTGYGHDGNGLGANAKYFTWTDPLHPATGEWHDTSAMVFPDRTEGFSLQLPIRALPGLAARPRVAVFGGGEPDQAARKTVEVFEGKDVARSSWVRTADMAEPRFHCMGVLLPDGTVLVMGGAEHDSDGTIGSHSSEIYDPESGKFSRQDDLQYARGYHSLCCLLPSGQVMAGAGIGGPNETTMEVFSPPYLFRGPRPTIQSAPAEIVYGSKFELGTPDAKRIRRAVLVRPMAFTHNTDSEQRLVELRLQSGEGVVRLEAPGGSPPYPNAPAGYYMLFLLDRAGVPSESVFVRLRSAPVYRSPR